MEPRMMIQEGLTPLSKSKKEPAVKHQKIQNFLHQAIAYLDNAGLAVNFPFKSKNDEIFNTGYGEAV